MSKTALIIGIDEYDHTGNLNFCSKDANEVEKLLSVNYDGSPNFETHCYTTEKHKGGLTSEFLNSETERLFQNHH